MNLQKSARKIGKIITCVEIWRDSLGTTWLQRVVVMPAGKPWHFTDSPTGGVYVSVGNVILRKYGTVKQLAKSSNVNGQENVIKVWP